MHEKLQTNCQPSQKYTYNLQNLNKLNPSYYDPIALYQIAYAQLLSEIQNTPLNFFDSFFAENFVKISMFFN